MHANGEVELAGRGRGQSSGDSKVRCRRNKVERDEGAIPSEGVVEQAGW